MKDLQRNFLKETTKSKLKTMRSIYMIHLIKLSSVALYFAGVSSKERRMQWFCSLWVQQLLSQEPQLESFTLNHRASLPRICKSGRQVPLTEKGCGHFLFRATQLLSPRHGLLNLPALCGPPPLKDSCRRWSLTSWNRATGQSPGRRVACPCRSRTSWKTVRRCCPPRMSYVAATLWTLSQSTLLAQLGGQGCTTGARIGITLSACAGDLSIRMVK